MSFIKVMKGWREVLRLTLFKKGPRLPVSKTDGLPRVKQTKYENHHCSQQNDSIKKINSTFLRSIVSRNARLLGKHRIASLRANRLRRVPVFSLLGLSLGLDMDLSTNSCNESTMFAVRNVFKDYEWDPDHLENKPKSLNDLDINKTSVIGNGCEGAVFEAKLKNDSAMDANKIKRQEYNLAVKAIFNYGAESNASSILRMLRREIVPLQPSDCEPNQLEEINTNIFRLPPHPNVVEMHSIFIDDMLITEQGKREFPAAMPGHEGGFGRNKTLYLVMKKCSTKLSDFLLSSEITMTTRCLLLAQLLEAVHHMTSHGVAHRDIKADNILIDVPVTGGTPNLQVCDFGCCLAESNGSLQVPFESNDVNLGGNLLLMAPEISCATPGVGHVLDYRKSDIWACGTLAYQILGVDNPFYPNDFKQLKSKYYTEVDLPPLPENVPVPIKRLVKSLLARDPAKRPSPSVAILVVQMVLWERTAKHCQNLAGGNRRQQPHRVVMTKGKRVSSYIQYVNKEKQKIGLVLGEMFELIKRMSSSTEASIVKRDVVEISNFLCLSRLTQSDFSMALKFFR